MILDRVYKLVSTVPIKTISAPVMAKDIVTHWVLTYGPPKWLLSDNRAQFTCRLFHDIWRILGVESTFTTTYHPQANSQVERLSRIILQGLRHYVAHHPTDWIMYTGMLTYAYSRQIYSSTGCAPFELVISKPLHFKVIERK